MNCYEIPSVLSSSPPKTACERLAAAQPACVCEACSVEPALSPGIVNPGEILARFVSDHHFDTEGNVVKPSLFSHAGTNGMSVTRIERAGKEVLIRQQQTNGYLGYVDASCQAIRNILNGAEQAFGIYDTALPDNRAHADVCQTVFRPKSVASEMRHQLALAFAIMLKSATD